MYIEPHIVDNILAQADILDIALEYLPDLKKRGDRWWTKSPFKEEKTPSFSISPSRQAYYCFSTKKGGNVATLLQELDNNVTSWLEAVHLLARKYGVDIQPEMSDKQRAIAQRRERLGQLVSDAAEYYHKNLYDGIGEAGQEYLLDRGIDLSDIAKLKIGYSIESWSRGKDYLLKKGYQPQELVEVGIAKSKDGNGHIYDFFRNRIMFPIHDHYGRVVGFGGRTIGDDNAKYINSPESIIYKKNEVLYGLHRAIDGIKEMGYAALVEGYLDVDIPSLRGSSNGVAPCGTSLTSLQAKLLKRYTNEVVICFDDDEAGHKAALRAIDIFLAEGMTPKVCTLPDGHDPASFVGLYGVEKYNEVLDNAEEWYIYAYNRLKLQHADTPAGRAAISDALLESIRNISHEVLREEYTREVAKLLGYNTQTLIEKSAIGELELPRKLNWEQYTSILKKTSTMKSEDFKRAPNGAVEVSYKDFGGVPYTKTKNGEKVEIKRVSTELENQYGIYLPFAIRGGMASETLLIVQDEITADILCQCNIPAIGISRKDGFRSSPRGAMPDKLLKRLLPKVRRVVYALPGEAFMLPSAKHYKDIDAAVLSESYVDALIALTQTLPKHRVWVMLPEHRAGTYNNRSPRWIESLLLKHGANDLIETDVYIEDPEYKSENIRIVEVSDFTRKQHEELLYLDSAQNFFNFHGEVLGETFRFKKDTWEVNLKTGQVDKLTTWRPEPDIFERDGEYYAKGRGGIRHILNVKMDCKLLATGAQSFGLYRIENPRSRQIREVVIDTNDFFDQLKFAKRMAKLAGLGARSKMSSTQLLEFFEIITQGSPEAESVGDHIGRYDTEVEYDQRNDEKPKFWVFGNGLLSEETGKFHEMNEMNIVQLGEKNYFIPGRYDRQADFQYKEGSISMEDWIYDYIQVFGDNAKKAFCFAIMSMYYDIVKEQLGQIPLLHIVGPPNAGKNKIMECIFMLWSANPVWLDFQTDGITNAAYRAFYQQYTNGLHVSNEVNPSTVDERWIWPLKAHYEGQIGAKMTGPHTKEISTGQCTSADILLGQEPISAFRAINERVLQIQVPQKKYTNEETRRFNKFYGACKAGLGHLFRDLALNRRVIEENLGEKFERIQTRIKDMIQIPTPNTERMARNYATVLAPIFILIEEGIVPVLTHKDLLAYAVEEISKHEQELQLQGLIDIFFKDFIEAYYMKPKYGLSHNHVWWHKDRNDVLMHYGNDKKHIDTPEGTIHIQLNNTASLFEDYKRSKNLKLENSTKRDLKRELMAHPAFLYASKAEWLGYKIDENGIVLKRPFGDETKPVKYRSSALVFDAKTLGLNIDFEFSFDEEKVPY